MHSWQKKQVWYVRGAVDKENAIRWSQGQQISKLSASAKYV